MRRGMVCMWVAVAALAAWGMPTQKEIDQVKPLVEELMAARKRGKPQEAAEAALGFVADAESEAAKFLLYRTALELYAKAGDDEKTVETFMGLIETIPDVPYGVRAKLLQDAGRAIGRTSKPVQTEALYKQQTTLAVIDRELQKALKEIEADPNDAAAHLRAGNALAIFGEWPKALEHLSVSESAVAAVADEERTGRVSINESADGWWKVADTIRNATLKNAYRFHAVDLYRKAIADGTLTGLGKTLAERKIAEFEKEPEVIQPQRGGSGKPYLYCVIDLSGGPNAKKYPVSYLQKEPSTKTGFNTDEYKTTKLVLRRIEPGTFKMEGKYDVTLTKPFYIGIYEVTQKQYELVTGETPSEFKGDMRPVEKVSYDMIRGKSEGAKWPSSSVVDPESFMGKIRARTGLDFDLPTEAQWEYACRAGTASAFNNGGNSEDDLKKLGRFTLNQNSRGWLESDADFARHKPDGRGGHSANHTVVGSYMPNRWGLYDMHGNVWEWCCDWKGDLANSLTDPKGVVSGDARVLRGGSWDNLAGPCRSAYRRGGVPGRRDGSSGFRLCCSAGPRGSVEPTKPVAKPQPTQDMSGTRRKVQLWEGGPYWAEMNIGATKPEEYGYYFWWGDTVGYKRENHAWVASNGSSANFSFSKENAPTCGKSVDDLKNEGWITADSVLSPEHDAARVHWGGAWRMPTKQELDDLNNKCDWTWTKMNGVNGFLIKGKGAYASDSIFLPCSGLGKGTSSEWVGSFGYCWSSVPNSDNDNAWLLLFFFSGKHYTYFGVCRGEGRSVRPVQSVAK